MGIKKEPARAEKAEVVPIGDIISRPQEYVDREVTVEGKAIPGLAFEFVDEQPYLLKDSTGQIWVITRGFMPEEGKGLTVKGRVVAPYQIKGRRYEVVILEEDRR